MAETNRKGKGEKYNDRAPPSSSFHKSRRSPGRKRKGETEREWRPPKMVLWAEKGKKGSEVEKEEREKRDARKEGETISLFLIRASSFSFLLSAPSSLGGKREERRTNRLGPSEP